MIQWPKKGVEMKLRRKILKRGKGMTLVKQLKKLRKKKRVEMTKSRQKVLSQKGLSIKERQTPKKE